MREALRFVAQEEVDTEEARSEADQIAHTDS